MLSFRAPERRLTRRVLDAVATAWAIAALTAIGLVAAAVYTARWKPAEAA